MKILCIFLLLASSFLNIKHGYDAFRPPTAEQENVLHNLGISRSAMPYIGVFSILTGIMLLFPQTFFISNLLNAVSILLIMAFSLKANDIRTAVLEIPFLAIPLLLIWFKYPFPIKFK